MLVRKRDRAGCYQPSGFITKAVDLQTPIAEVLVVWAKTADDGVIRGFILAAGMQGLSTAKMRTP